MTLAFRRGDTWREPLTTLPIIGQTSNTVTLAVPVPLSISAGEAVTLTGGTPEVKGVTGYNPATGVVTFQNIANSGHTALELEAGLSINTPNVTVTDYGDGSPGHTAASTKPVLSQFNTPYYISAWQTNSQRGDGLTNTYTQSETGNVAWVRIAGDTTSLLRKQTSAADVDANPGSWYADGGRVWVSPLPRSGPVNNGIRLYEAVYSSHAVGIVVGDVPGVRLHNIRVDGYGASAVIPDFSYNGYGIQGGVQGTNNLVVDGCECYYNGRHSIANVCGQGGIVTIAGCRTAWTTSDGINTVIYATAGGQEALFWENDAVAGQAAVGQSFFPNFAGSGIGCFAHTNGGQPNNAQRIGLFLAWGNTNEPGQYQVVSPSGPSGTDAQDFTDLVNCRSWVVGETFNCREPTALDATCPNATGYGAAGYGMSGNTTYINCKLISRLVFLKDPVADLYGVMADASTVFLNTTLVSDWIGASGSNFAVGRNLSGGYSLGHWYNCRVHFKLYGGGKTGWDKLCIMNNNPASATTTVVQNSILSAEGMGLNQGENVGQGGAFYVGLGNNANDPAQMVNNCYSSVTDKAGVRGYDQDPHYVEAGDLPFGHPAPGSPLLTPFSQLVLGQYRLEYDADWNLRSTRTPAIGPYEPARLPSF